MSKLKRDRLEQLGVEKLAEVLLELADNDDMIEQQLIMLTATDNERLRKVRARIAGLSRIRRFHDWKSLRKLRDKISLTLENLEALQVEPRQAISLLVAFYQTDNAVYGNCDDSNGVIADLYKYDAHQLLLHFGKQCADKPWLAEQLFHLTEQNDYGVRDRVLEAAGGILPEPEVRRLIDRYCELAHESEEAENAGDEDDWRSSFRTRRHWRAAQTLARGIGDAALHEMALQAAWKKKLNAAAWNDIARVYLEAGDPETALEKLEEISDDDHFERHETEKLRIEIHRKLGGTDQLIELLREKLLESPHSDNLAEFLEVAGADRREEIVKSVASRYGNEARLNEHFAVFAFNETGGACAENYLLDRSDQINGERYHLLVPLAERFAQAGHPLAATLIYRSLADSILKRSLSKNYPIAVRYIKLAAGLADPIKAWHGHPDHPAYMNSLRENHKRKHALWNKLGAT